MDRRTILITGGSSGIGFEMSRLFAQENEDVRLLWISHQQDELTKAKSELEFESEQVEIHALVKDLSQAESAQEVFDWTKENHWKVDVLVNNAGIGTFGFLPEIPVENELRMIQLNILNLYKLTRLFLPEMLKRNAGKIMNISSSASFQPLPGFTTYAATKAFVRSFSTALDEELKDKKSNVRVITICPAAIKDTPFRKVANADNVRTFSSIGTTTAEEVAKDAIRALNKNKQLMLTGAKYRLLMSFSKVIPSFIFKKVVKRELQRTED